MRKSDKYITRTMRRGVEILQVRIGQQHGGGTAFQREINVQKAGGLPEAYEIAVGIRNNVIKRQVIDALEAEVTAGRMDLGEYRRCLAVVDDVVAKELER